MVYTMYIPALGINMVCTWYLHCIYHVYYFYGFQMVQVVVWAASGPGSAAGPGRSRVGRVNIVGCAWWWLSACWRVVTVSASSANPIPIISYYFTRNNMK